MNKEQKAKAMIEDIKQLARYQHGLIGLTEAEVERLRTRTWSHRSIEKEPSPNTPVIKLHETDFAKNGTRSIWRIYPTMRMRRLAIRAFRHAYPELNYILGWHDQLGYGLQMSVASWASAEAPYIDL